MKLYTRLYPINQYLIISLISKLLTACNSNALPKQSINSKRSVTMIIIIKKIEYTITITIDNCYYCHCRSFPYFHHYILLTTYQRSGFRIKIEFKVNACFQRNFPLLTINGHCLPKDIKIVLSSNLNCLSMICSKLKSILLISGI